MCAAKSIETFVLLFPNEEWAAADADDMKQGGTVSQLRPNISFAQHLHQDTFQTLSTHNAPAEGIKGFLYVPDLDRDSECFNASKAYVPTNVTRQANLPPADFTLVAIAPWINTECTHAYLDSAKNDPARALIFYLTDNGTTQPPTVHSSVWGLGDGGLWKTTTPFPVYSVPWSVGDQLMRELSLYSGNMTAVPYGHEIASLPNSDPRDYVRLYTKIRLPDSSELPGLWAYVLIIVAALIAMLCITSCSMHLLLRLRRRSLRRRVSNGEINLEALGIVRLTVPQEMIEKLPVFTYIDNEKETSAMLTSSKEDLQITSQRRLSTSSPEEINDSVAISPIEAAAIGVFQSHDQVTCPICLDDFVSGQTSVRQLECQHIFHPKCIDSFLANNSSLCPMCKSSVLPPGYCPSTLTNSMVRRERNIRRLRSRVTVNDDQAMALNYRGRLRNASAGVKNMGSSSTSSREVANQTPLQPQSYIMTSAVPENTRGPVLGNEILDRAELRRSRREQMLQAHATQQSPVGDNDTINSAQRPKWKRNLAKVFPGFA